MSDKIMKSFSFDKNGYIIDGVRQFMVSGEFHYFRVPKADWERRLNLFKEAGGNTVATYVPWCVHEQVEGEIRFDDCEERDFSDFLRLCDKLNVKVMVRPGPYQYSELSYDGLPAWLYENYPEVRAVTENGEFFDFPVFSYCNPLFLEKTKKYYDAFCKVVKPFLVTNGGPVVVIQLDNELTGVHLWRGSPDYNENAMEIEKKGGKYSQFLKNKYTYIEKLNKTYNTNYVDFDDVRPQKPVGSKERCANIRGDYHEYYLQRCGDFCEILAGFLRDNGIADVTLCHNAASWRDVALLSHLNDRFKENFVLGVDQYYALNHFARSLNPDNRNYVLNYMYSADILKQLGNPYTVFEMQAGTYGHVPAILANDLYALYMANLAVGMQGVNYYIYTGGGNSAEFGVNSAVYDYRACIGADGEIRENYKAIKKFGTLLKNNKWLVSTDRVYSVNVGLENWDARFRSREGGTQLEDISQFVTYSAQVGKFAPHYTLLDLDIPKDKPLIVYGTCTLSKAIQEKIINFIQDGGNVLFFNGVATKDSDYSPCTLLYDFIGANVVKDQRYTPVVKAFDKDVYGINCNSVAIESYKEGDEPVMVGRDNSKVCGIKGKRGKGNFIFSIARWITCTKDQIELWEDMLENLGAKPIVRSSNPSIICSIRSNGTKSALFVLNLHSCAQSTSVTVYLDGKEQTLENVKLKPMEVKMIKL